MLHVTGFTQSTITAIWRSNVVLIYSSISGSPRTVSMRFDLSEITQSQGLRHSLCFLFRDNENLKRGILPSVFSLQFIHRARPAEVPAAARHVSGQKSFFQICSYDSFWILGCPLQGGSEDQTLLLVLFPVDFSSRIEFHTEPVTDIINGLAPHPLHMPPWCFRSLRNAFNYCLWLACKALLTVVSFQIEYETLIAAYVKSETLCYS